MKDINDSIYLAESTIAALEAALRWGSDTVRRPKGSISALAAKLKCHVSFVSQVLASKSHLSVDQLLSCAKHFELNEKATEYWLMLLLKDKSANHLHQKYFESKAHHLKEAHSDISKRWQAPTLTDDASSSLFFSSWLKQSLYSLLPLPNMNTVLALAARLCIPHEVVEKELTELMEAGLVKRNKAKFEPEHAFLHLGKESPLIQLHHSTWRQKVLGEFVTRPKLGSTHYSGIVTVSLSDAKFIRAEILAMLDKIKALAMKSTSEEARVLLVDFFAI